MRKKGKILSLLISLIFLGISIYIIVSYPPTFSLNIMNQELSILYIFLSLFFLFTAYFFAFVFKNTRRGLFMALFLISFLLLNYHKLGQPVFVILLIAIFVALELLFARRK